MKHEKHETKTMNMSIQYSTFKSLFACLPVGPIILDPRGMTNIFTIYNFLIANLAFFFRFFPSLHTFCSNYYCYYYYYYYYLIISSFSFSFF